MKSYFDWKSSIQSTVSDTILEGRAQEEQSYLPKLLPHPGSILLNGIHSSVDNHITIRASIPYSPDDDFIANLHLSVFSNFDKERQDLFRSRSLEVLNIRRRRGAVALIAEMSVEDCTNVHYHNEMESRIVTGHMYGAKAVASKPISETEKTRFQKKIIGSVECSQHEFYQTMLGNSRRKNALLYVTEVAVCPEARRCGAGMMLMKGVDEVAALRNVESIYLHVDVTNQAACAMYEKAGYRILDKREPMYAQFTASLNLHDGALMGRCHYLMCKDMTAKNTRTEDERLTVDVIEEHLALLRDD